MKKILVLSLIVMIISGSVIPGKEKTFCNPMNLNYRFQPTSGTSYREAADPFNNSLQREILSVCFTFGWLLVFRGYAGMDIFTNKKHACRGLCSGSGHY